MSNSGFLNLGNFPGKNCTEYAFFSLDLSKKSLPKMVKRKALKHTEVVPTRLLSESRTLEKALNRKTIPERDGGLTVAHKDEKGVKCARKSGSVKGLQTLRRPLVGFWDGLKCMWRGRGCLYPSSFSRIAFSLREKESTLRNAGVGTFAKTDGNKNPLRIPLSRESPLKDVR